MPCCVAIADDGTTVTKRTKICSLLHADDSLWLPECSTHGAKPFDPLYMHRPTAEINGWIWDHAVAAS